MLSLQVFFGLLACLLAYFYYNLRQNRLKIRKLQQAGFVSCLHRLDISSDA